jgi:2-dehydro-3-deoxygluconokinase
MKNIILMGECMVELRRDVSGVIAQSFAGDVYNAGVYLKRTCPTINVQLASQVGTDTLSEQMLAAFADEDIDSSLVLQDPQRMPGLYWVNTDASGERSFLYWRESAAARWQVENYDATYIEKLKQADIFFFSGISIAILQPEHRERFWEVLRVLKESGVKIAFDPNYRPKLWQSVEDTKAQYDIAFSLSDIALPGVEDFDMLYGLSDFDAVETFLAPYQINEQVIKDGPNGVVVIADNTRTFISITPVENVVDTTSAGDSFNGAYLGSRMTVGTIEAAVAIAAKMAGTVIQHPGAIIPKSV